MQLLNIKKAFEKKLLQLTPSIQTAFENTVFKPEPNVPYQRVQLIPFDPENPTLGDSHYREVGEFQVFLCYPINEGSGKALLRAELLRKHFDRGTTLLEGSTVINILRTPQITGNDIIGDRLVVAVIVKYSADIFSVE